MSVAVVGGSVSPKILTDLQSKVTQTKTTLETGDATLIGALTREDLLGDLFYAGTSYLTSGKKLTDSYFGRVFRI